MNGAGIGSGALDLFEIVADGLLGKAGNAVQEIANDVLTNSGLGGQTTLQGLQIALPSGTSRRTARSMMGWQLVQFTLHDARSQHHDRADHGARHIAHRLGDEVLDNL